MNHSYESSHSNLLVLSDMEQGKTSLRYEQFIKQLSQIYGIPLLQLDDIYTNTIQPQQQLTKAQSLETNSVFDYADKLAVNHNILKELLHMIDSKVTFRHSDITDSLSFTKIKLRQYSATDKAKPADGSKQELKGRLEQKMLQVRERLQQTVQFINRELQVEIGSKIKKVITMDDIKENSSQYQLSLQYSHQFQQDEGKQQNVEKQVKSKVNGQKQKEDEIKKIVEKDQSKNKIETQQKTKIKENINHSLERISEVLSGETIEKVQRPEQVNSSLRVSARQRDYEIKEDEASLKMSNEPSAKQIYSEKEVDDQTGRIIRSTINKKKTSTTIFPVKDKMGSSLLSPVSQPKSQDEQPNDSTLMKNIKKSKFWIDHRNNLQFYTKTVDSHEQIEESRVIREPFNKDSFKFEKKRSKERLESKLELLNHMNEKQTNKMRSIKNQPQKQENNNQIAHQQEKYATFGVIKSGKREENQFARFPLPYTLPSRTDFNQVKKPELYKLKPLIANIHQQKRDQSAPYFRESRVTESYPRLVARPQAVVAPQQIFYVNYPQYQLSQKSLPFQRLINNPENQSIRNQSYINSRPQQKYMILNEPVKTIMNPLLQRIPIAINRPIGMSVRPSSVPLKSINYAINSPASPQFRQYQNNLNPLVALNKIQNLNTNIMRTPPSEQFYSSNLQLARAIPMQNNSINLFKVGVGNKKFNFSQAKYMNNSRNIRNDENIINRKSSGPSQLLHRQGNTKSIIENLVPSTPISKTTSVLQNPFNILKQIQSASRQTSAGFRYSLNKDELQKIVEISEESMNNSAMKEIGEGSGMNSKITPNQQSMRSNRGTSSRKMKKTGIYITNQISIRANRSQYNPSQ